MFCRNRSGDRSGVMVRVKVRVKVRVRLAPVERNETLLSRLDFILQLAPTVVCDIGLG